jgi:membrane protease YdiL (CAAX protease family)
MKEQVSSRVSGRAVASVLIAFPLAYVVNSGMPWSRRFTAEGDHAYYVPFLISIMLLHWLSVAVAWRVARAHGYDLSGLGLVTPMRRALGAAVVLLLVAALGVAARELFPPQEPLLRIPPAGLHLDGWAERAWWVPFAFTAAFCEEFVYRGFGITALRSRGHPPWRAVALATTSWCLVHGLGGVLLFPAYFVAGVGFSALFLWWRSLVPVMAVHVLIVLTVLGS